ncbi:rRNA-processing protein UTP23 homolog [Macrotis lagotis]|uniref:rRNA-processing protein UTP23 homolog n=1 Tax=Macrotis lagotis TaxID=92651 RepID=UPI003D68FF62
MKITRQKHAKKYLGFFRNNFGVREPYQLLLDGTFCQAALRGRIQLREQLPRYLMGETQLCTTRCVLKELESLGKELYGAKLIAQRCQVRSCSHFKDAISGAECLLSMIEDGNPHHFFVATQDQNLSLQVKKNPGVPLLFIIQNTVVLDKPSTKTVAFVKATESGHLVSVHQKQSIKKLKEEQGLVKTPEQKKKRKRKGVSGPNPLSCLKKKKKVQDSTQSSAPEKKKRKRIRNRNRTKALFVPSSVKQSEEVK